MAPIWTVNSKTGFNDKGEVETVRSLKGWNTTELYKLGCISDLWIERMFGNHNRVYIKMGLTRMRERDNDIYEKQFGFRTLQNSNRFVEVVCADAQALYELVKGSCITIMRPRAVVVGDHDMERFDSKKYTMAMAEEDFKILQARKEVAAPIA